MLTLPQARGIFNNSTNARDVCRAIGSLDERTPIGRLIGIMKPSRRRLVFAGLKPIVDSTREGLVHVTGDALFKDGAFFIRDLGFLAMEDGADCFAHFRFNDADAAQEVTRLLSVGDTPLSEVDPANQKFWHESHMLPTDVEGLSTQLVFPEEPILIRKS